MKKVCFLNNGCLPHEEQFQKIFKSMEESYVLTNFPHNADVIVQYLCAMSEEQAVSKAFDALSYISKMKKEKSVLIVCGCFVNVVGKEFFSEMKFVDYVVESSYNMVSEILEILKLQWTDEYYIEKYDTSFLIDIVGGCQKKHGWCTFCKQHYLKRPVRSVPLEEVIRIVKSVTQNSCVHTIYLGGLNTCNYGIDLGDGKPKLHNLIKEISKIPTVKFIKLLSLTVESMYEELNCEIERNQKVLLVELPLQSGSNSMLEIMNVGSKSEQALALLKRFSACGKQMRSMVIVSHPEETREFLQETIDVIVKSNLWYVTISPYQNSTGTKSSLMRQLDEKEYNYHYSRLSDTVMELKQKFLNSLIGLTIEGILSGGERYEEEDILEATVQASEFEGGITIEIPNFSSSPYKTLLEKVELGAKVRAKILAVSDFEENQLIGTDLEVI